MFNIINQYKILEKHIINLIIAEFFIQLINSAFLLILLIYMQKSGFNDYESADFISFRFLGTLILAFPLGLLLKGRKIKPFFLFASYAVPLFAFLIIYSVKFHWYSLLYFAQFMWGASFLCIQVTALPFILRNARFETRTEAISLNYATYSLAGICSGILIFLLKNLSPDFFTEKNILLTISALGFFSIYFVRQIHTEELVPEKTGKLFDLKSFDWHLITKALLPTLVIAVGAGLTIPFIGIFFFNVHHVDSDQFAFLGSVAAVFVALGSLLVPQIKNRVGYKTAVLLTQAIAVIALIILASTEWYNETVIAVYIAIFCYIIRQPLMNMAGPMISEIDMNYVGKKNREITSALASAIWSGSWFISSRIFKFLRENNVSYVNVFFITAALYALGVIVYYFLIRDYERRIKTGLINMDNAS